MSRFTNPASRSLEEAATYTDAILDLLGDRDPLEVLPQTLPAIDRLLDGLTDGQATQPEAPGKWSARHVVQHLADSELVWGYRIRFVLAHDRPTLTGYDQDRWVARLRYDDIPVEEAREDFAALRASNLRQLARLTAEDRQRVGVHAERGEESVEHMIRLYAGHDLVHLQQLERIRRSVAG